MLNHKTNLDMFKRIEIISSIFSDPSGMKLEINYTKKIGKLTNMWRLHNMLLSSQEIKTEIKKYLETNKNKMQHSNIYGMQQKKF